MIVDQCIEDYGSGLDYNRRKWNGLLDEVMEQKVKTIVITHKDRFIRFGYEWFERFCMRFHTTILVVNNEELSPQEELVQDIIDNQYAIGYASFGVANQNEGKVTPLKVNGVAATKENILDGSYIIQRPLLLVGSGDPTDVQQAFLDYVLGDEGQKTVEDMGFIPMK